MSAAYAGHGIHFRYPPNWEVTVQEGERSLSVTVSSPDTSFWSIALLFDRPAPQEVVESAVEAFRDEYEEVDVYRPDDARAARAGEGACAARDVDFVFLELISSAFLRSFETDRATVLVLFQGFDGELETTRPLMEAISGSLTFDGDELTAGNEAARNETGGREESSDSDETWENDES